MTKKYNRVIAACMADSHGGHVLGLVDPKTELQSEKLGIHYPQLNDYQKYLWDDVYIKGIEDTFHLAGRDEIILFHKGDITQGNKYPNEQFLRQGIIYE